MHTMLYGENSTNFASLHYHSVCMLRETIGVYSQTLVDQSSGKPDDVNWLAKVLARYRFVSHFDGCNESIVIIDHDSFIIDHLV